MSSDPPPRDHSKHDTSESGSKRTRPLPFQGANLLMLARNIAEILPIKRGIFTPNYLSAAGFYYTGDGDTARCKQCGLIVSNWTKDMIPFIIHSKQKPDCPFIHSVTTSSVSNKSTASSSTTAIRNTSTSNEHENPSKRIKIETTDFNSLSNTLLEADLTQQVRRRTFSHWPHRTTPSSAQMIEAGFFNCNVGDRVICIYCNLICQQWTPHTDDPCEVHKTLSPNCIYVKAKLIRPSASSIIIVNESPVGVNTINHSPTSSNLEPLRSNEIVFTAACNPAYAALSKRHASFTTWPNENSPPVDDLARAGFFYTGTKTIVTCFYCNGSLQKWGPNDNPMIEHARWFPHCAYATQLCGDEMYRKIQESKRAQQERARANEASEKANSGVVTTTNPTANSGQLLIPDESTLTRIVAARLDLPISQRLLNQNFKLSVIKRCWEDQLRLKHDDFISETDLYMACVILQKQIEHIDDRSMNNLSAAGFECAGDGDVARCSVCGLEVNIQRLDVHPFTIHAERSPHCLFVRSRRISLTASEPSASGSINSRRKLGTSSEQENIHKRQKNATVDLKFLLNSLFGTPLLQQIQRGTFSHWSDRDKSSSSQMIDAGFFYCNTGDRVICIYCNLICHQWALGENDPCEVHRTFSPDCKYVRTKLIRSSISSNLIVNTNPAEPTSSNQPLASASAQPVGSNVIVHAAANNSMYFEIPKRHASFSTWPKENLPSVDDLVRAGFFYAGTKTIVTCFYCNGSLQNWGPNDNPIDEHARWFPHCAYAKQLCGDELHRRIQESEQAQQERGSSDQTRGSATSNHNQNTNSRQLLIKDENDLAVLVADRLKSSISQIVLNQNVDSAVVRRCWENQLRLKEEDFVSEYDLFIACSILLKQLEHLAGKEENIVIPSVKMEQIRKQNGSTVDPQATTTSHRSTSSQSSGKSAATPSNPCVLCLTEEKRLACIPCGHLATCVPCGQPLRSCPICRREIEDFVRIYI